jgi:hypothetical protein
MPRSTTTLTRWHCISVGLQLRPHPQTLKVSPAIAAGISKCLWEMKDVVIMLEAWEKVATRK